MSAPEPAAIPPRGCPECGSEGDTVLCDGCKFETCRACGFPCACGGEEVIDAEICETCRDPGFITCVDYDGSGYETACPDCQVPDAERDPAVEVPTDAPF